VPSASGAVSFAGQTITGGQTHFGFTAVRRTSSGHYCLTLEPALRPFAFDLVVNVSAVKHGASGPVIGSPLVYQEIPVPSVAAPCGDAEIKVATELISGGAAPTASDQVAFALTAN
jgi:hypothetical protein